MPSAFLRHIADIPDPRREHGRQHPLVTIIGVAFVAFLAGADAWTEVEDFAHQHRDWLATRFDLSNGIPSHDTFSRVFRLLDSRRFADGFDGWLQEILGPFRGHLAIDGKACARAIEQGQPRSTLSAFATALGVGFGCRAFDGSELDTLRGLVQDLDLRGCTVSVDAIGTHADVAAAIRERGGDWLLALKGNQSGVHRDVVDFVDDAEREGFHHLSPGSHERLDLHGTGHGREERRTIQVYRSVKWLAKVQPAWAPTRTIVVVDRFSRRADGSDLFDGRDRRFFLCSRTLDALEAATLVRDHWKIENHQHHVLDVTFAEDRSRMRKDHAAANAAILRRQALNLLRTWPGRGTTSLRRLRKQAGWNPKILLQILSADRSGPTEPA